MHQQLDSAGSAGSAPDGDSASRQGGQGAQPVVVEPGGLRDLLHCVVAPKLPISLLQAPPAHDQGDGR
jgi:hypothetical protein